jgi:hypothetical protein
MGKDSSDEHDHVAGRALEQGQALQSRARHHTGRARIAQPAGADQRLARGPVGRAMTPTSSAAGATA